MNITVYLGAFEGNDMKLKNAVSELGTYIGDHGHTLVYGGSKTGLMGLLALAALNAGGKVIGVEPEMFIEKDFQYEGLTELIVTADMPSRKTKMIELGDAFIAFPGGTGTLEEISEIMAKVSLKMFDAPCIFYNIDGYYNPMKDLLENMKKKGLSTDERLKGIYFAENLDQIDSALNG